MSTVEDFKSAPVGATATHEATGSRAMKADNFERNWITPNGFHLDDEEMARRGYTLDPLWPAPTTAREAIELAWELAHPVKEGQVIPEGTRYLEYYSSVLEEYTAGCDFEITPALAQGIRTLDPLPDPEPDWLDALVVLARHVNQEPDSPPSLWANLGGMWGNVETTKRATVWDLRDVIPLYPKEGQEA